MPDAEDVMEFARGILEADQRQYRKYNHANAEGYDYP